MKAEVEIGNKKYNVDFSKGYFPNADFSNKNLSKSNFFFDINLKIFCSLSFYT